MPNAVLGSLGANFKPASLPPYLKMANLSVLDSNADPQGAFPFTRLPTEMRLLIYEFVFQGCQATARLDAEYSDEYAENWDGRRRKTLVRNGQCCYEHFGRGFSLLATSKMMYNEAVASYWSETVLTVTRNVKTSCDLAEVCAYLPPIIKKNVCHLRGTKLPIRRKNRPTEGDPDWTPTLLMQLPKLKSCVFLGRLPLAGGLKPAYWFRVPDSERRTPKYDGVGPFHVDGGVSPASFLEEKLGVRQDCGVIFLSRASGELPKIRPPQYKTRVSLIHMYMSLMEKGVLTDLLFVQKQYFNYTTGMVYQTTKPLKDEEGFEVVMEAKEGSE